MKKRIPLCACGCGQRVRRYFHVWVNGHVPRSVRSAGGAKGRSNYAFKRRRMFFDAALKRLTADGRRFTQEDLLAVFNDVYTHGYQVGYKAADAKWSGRKFVRKAAA